MIQLYDISKISEDEIFQRALEQQQGVAERVADILAQVRARGDAALYEYSERFDKVSLSSLAVTQTELEAAYHSVEPHFVEILEEAAANIENFHRRQKRESYIVTDKPGVVLGQRVLPLECVGLYVPGGTAAYPSSVLMNAIPARLAGVRELVMVTPPSRDGSVNPHILAAARVAGVSRIFKLGGAQAVAALAFGTETVPRVDKIVGPGNVYVAEAKRQVFGQVNIDMIAGPSEILVLADESANPVYVAADLLSQAEHDRMASAVLVTDCEVLAEAVSQELERQLPLLERADIARASIDHYGKIILTGDMDSAVEMANRLAPEHLELAVAQPFDYLNRIENAGSVFMGHYTPEPMGDYFSGTNHTLPTLGTARFYSPLSVDDFVKKMQFSYYTKEALRQDYEKVSYFARREGLTAHARAVELRFEAFEGEKS